MISAQSDGDAINRKLDSLCEGHRLASQVVILHCYIERFKCRIISAQAHQLIHTCALEVKPATIKSPVVWVTIGRACGVTDGYAGWFPIHHTASFIGGARSLLACDHTQLCVTLASATTSLISPKALACLVVAAFIGTATCFSRHTDACTEYITPVTHTAFHTVPGANLWLIREWTGWLAWTGTITIVAVTWTVHCWTEKESYGFLKVYAKRLHYVLRKLVSCKYSRQPNFLLQPLIITPA